MNAGTLTIPVGSGRIQCTTAVPSGYAPNAVPFNGNVCVAPGVAPRSFMSGVGYGPNGRICVDISGAAITTYLAGLALTANGALACDTTGAITNYVHGLPVTAQGRLAISAPVVVAAGLSDLDDDEKPDTVLLDSPGGGPDVTIDDDSINIDLDGDGRADVVVPR